MVRKQVHQNRQNSWGIRLMAALAIVLLVLAPRGFMVSAQAHGPIPLVICSGETATASKDPAGNAPATKSHGSTCIFSGHGLALTPPTHPSDMTGAVFRIHRDNIHFATTRGALPLASPPPPSQASPTTI